MWSLRLRYRDSVGRWFSGQAKDHSQFTSDAAEVWVHGDVPRGPEEETVARLGSRTLVF